METKGYLQKLSSPDDGRVTFITLTEAGKALSRKYDEHYFNELSSYLDDISEEDADCMIAYNLLSAIFRGLGDSKSPLLFVLVACIVNVIGDLALVAGLHMDAAGAAIATVSAQALSVVFAVILLMKKDLPFIIARVFFNSIT